MYKQLRDGDKIKIVNKNLIGAGDDLTDGNMYTLFTDLDGDLSIIDDAGDELVIIEEDDYEGYVVLD